MNFKSKPFIYENIRNEIEKQILSGSLGIGSKISSERELASEFGCNFHTVRKALSFLEKEGVLERKIGSGTFVRSLPGANYPLTPPAANNSGLKKVGLLFDPTGGGDYLTSLLGSFKERSKDCNVDLDFNIIIDFSDSGESTFMGFDEAGFDALIIPWFSQKIKQQNIPKFIEKCTCPVVLPVVIPGLEKNCFQQGSFYGEGNYRRTRMQCQYFEKIGYSNIALLGPYQVKENTFQDCLVEYSRYVNETGIDSLVGMIDDGNQGEKRVIDRWESFKGDIGVVCYDDVYALRFISALHKFGWRVPEDIGIISYNNIPGSEQSFPPLSTMQFPFDFAAKTMLEHAISMADGKDNRQLQHAPQKFVIRESCGGVLRLGKKKAEEITEALENSILLDSSL